MREHTGFSGPEWILFSLTSVTAWAPHCTSFLRCNPESQMSPSAYKGSDLRRGSLKLCTCDIDSIPVAVKYGSYSISFKHVANDLCLVGTSMQKMKTLVFSIISFPYFLSQPLKLSFALSSFHLFYFYTLYLIDFQVSTLWAKHIQISKTSRNSLVQTDILLTCVNICSSSLSFLDLFPTLLQVTTAINL